MMETFRIISRSEAATRCLGRLLGLALSPGVTVLLSGDLGAGKTVFVKGVGEALGLTCVRSPSFTLVNEYQSERFLLAHADLYRLDESGADELGLEEYAGAEDAVLMVEWPDRWRFPPETDVLNVVLSVPGEGERELELCARGERAEPAALRVAAGVRSGDCPGAGLMGEREETRWNP